MILNTHLPEIQRIVNAEDPTKYEKLNLIRYYIVLQRKDHTRPPIDHIERHAGDTIEYLSKGERGLV